MNLGFEDEFGNDLNQKHVVNFSYMMFCISSVLMLVVFTSRCLPAVAIFVLLDCS
ncbi:hypothetical protein [Marinomonas rhodophyticola]|uniref:Uncharacterized protein n=1 Tax=Marinomonas rhodophyticola TaxID=2992803 RepID=A0ABT3KCR2_9GAMM|nr:hypothetical protein [Marinomonas sp. KJ51-3]MCW4628331.1 hypothetical protein [Marinomonas sp. KJ51-3]